MTKKELKVLAQDLCDAPFESVRLVATRAGEV
jgi:hypothetical protein